MMDPRYPRDPPARCCDSRQTGLAAHAEDCHLDDHDDCDVAFCTCPSNPEQGPCPCPCDECAGVNEELRQAEIDDAAADDLYDRWRDEQDDRDYYDERDENGEF